MVISRSSCCIDDNSKQNRKQSEDCICMQANSGRRCVNVVGSVSFRREILFVRKLLAISIRVSREEKVLQNLRKSMSSRIIPRDTLFFYPNRRTRSGNEADGNSRIFTYLPGKRRIRRTILDLEERGAHHFLFVIGKSKN